MVVEPYIIKLLFLYQSRYKTNFPDSALSWLCHVRSPINKQKVRCLPDVTVHSNAYLYTLTQV